MPPAPAPNLPRACEVCDATRFRWLVHRPERRGAVASAAGQRHPLRQRRPPGRWRGGSVAVHDRRADRGGATHCVVADPPPRVHRPGRLDGVALRRVRPGRGGRPSPDPFRAAGGLVLHPPVQLPQACHQPPSDPVAGVVDLPAPLAAGDGALRAGRGVRAGGIHPEDPPHPLRHPRRPPAGGDAVRAGRRGLRTQRGRTRAHLRGAVVPRPSRPAGPDLVGLRPPRPAHHDRPRPACP